MDDLDKVRAAHRHVAAVVGFYIHGLVFVLVMALLLAINVASGAPWWVVYVLLGWGAGLLGHAILVFGQANSAFRHWQDRQVKAYLDRH